MVFSSVSFLFYFLPSVLALYYITPKRFRGIRNLILLIFSLLFYFIGEPKAILIMFASIFSNYICGLVIGLSKEVYIKRISLVVAIISNLGYLFYYKYLNFTISILNNISGSDFPMKEIIMPIGISFFIFQGLSYVFDVYMGNASYMKNPLNISLYISLFPQLIAGPIVRYETVCNEIREREETLEDFSYGILRFIVGFGKKVLLANKFGFMADEIFGLNLHYNINPSLAWFGAFVYSMQIYFDFSGYSDMAIGLGQMFGFHFLENFNYPYISKSITDFWRRWHISLSTWFRDYVYIPLGGNRKGPKRHLINLFVVWFLTGLWHGASWNYIIWGMYFFNILMFEKFFLKKYEAKIPNLFRHIYALFFIVIGWVIFRIEDLNFLVKYLYEMFSFGGESNIESVVYYLKQYYFEIILGLLSVSSILKEFELGKIKTYTIPIYFLIFIFSIISLLSSTYNPFIYFRF